MKDKRRKLTESYVREIVAACQAGEPQKDVARRFLVSTSTVAFIMQGRTWTKVSGIPPLTRPCVDCGQPNVGSMYRACAKCRMKIASAEAKRRGLCQNCRRVAPAAGKKSCLRCLSQRRGKGRETKLHVFKTYGGTCACCGESNPGFLTIDHVKGDGNEHRRQLNMKSGGIKFYRWLIREDFPEGFQVLCYNCNLGRAHNSGICPHQSAS